MSAKFLQRVLEDTFGRAHDPEQGTLRLTALTEVLLQMLEDAAVLTSPEVAYYRFERGNIAAEVHGYAFDAEDDVVQLIYCIDATGEVPLEHPADLTHTTKESLDRAFRRLEAFVRRTLSDRMEEIEESLPAHDLAEMIHQAERNGHSIELHVITTGKVAERYVTSRSKGDLSRKVWDIIQLERICGDRGDGAITIDFLSDYSTTLPCLVTPKTSDGIQVYMTCIPGRLLAEIYNSHRATLLERNVRSFLQLTGKVNKGIRATVLNEPHRFLPYNNGLSATAGNVEIDVFPGGLGQIRVVHDFQIVNGGQTTATLAGCLRSNIDLSAVSVPMKLTVVLPMQLDGLVPQISRYANTQNRIQDSDFSANDPWHVGIERVSRSLWTNAIADAPRGTQWFYERSRGQYSDALSACQPGPARKRFRIEHPASQKFTKTDLAKFLLSWDQYPSIVSRGAQKCFHFFMSKLKTSHRSAMGESEFRRIIALAILFRRVEKLYSQMGYQNFRAQVVSYSIAKLSHDSQRRLDSEGIWKSQCIPDHLLSALKVIVPGVREVIVSPISKQKNVTEWCKKDDCWEAVLNRKIESGLTDSNEAPIWGMSTIPATDNLNQYHLITSISRVPADVWFSVSNWAKSTGSLQSWQRSLAYSLGRNAVSMRKASIKQAVQGRNLLLESVRLGFRHEGLTDDHVTELSMLNDVSA